MLPQTTSSFCKDKLYGGTVPLTHENLKLNLVSKAPENIIRTYYTLKLGSFCCFYWTMGDWSADRLSTPNFRKWLPKQHDEIS
jgi:hypothetical protein